MSAPRETTRLLPSRRPPLLSIPLSQSLRSEWAPDLPKQYHDCESLELPPAASSFDWFAYLSYYVPILRWLPQYQAQNFLGDFLAGVSLASFQVPLVMSLATSLAKLPPLVGLYSVVASSLSYAVFGTVPTLVVGPLPSTAVLYGQVIEKFAHSPAKEFASLSPTDISATLSVAMSAILLVAGLLRWGFLDNILSQALLKGFIGAMGVIMIANQLAIQMGLQDLAESLPHATIIDKLRFAISHVSMAHIPTVSVTVCTLAIVLVVRKMKLVLQEKHGVRSAVYIPELLAMVVVATFFSYYYGWESQGIAIVGDLSGSKKAKHRGIFVNPFHFSRLSLFKSVFGTSLLCSILGFFDSTTATKGLGSRYNYNVSANRELVALGMCNFAIIFVGGMPSFGALGRSKVNILAGACTPLATVIMGCTVILAVRYLLPFLYYLPECVLSLSTTIIGITVLEEVPHDVRFFWNIQGYDEVVILLVVFCATIFWSVEAGVILGIVIAIARVIKHGSRSRIHILGRIPNTSVFRNADELIEESFTAHFASGEENDGSAKLGDFIAEIEQIEGVLIIKIPEPLNFANLGDLRKKLNRIERFGTLSVHPSQPLVSGIDNGAIKFIIFDCKGMTSLDASSTQTLHDIVKRYHEVNKVHVAFSRVPVNKKVRARLLDLGIVKVVNSSYKLFCGMQRSEASETNSAAQLPNVPPMNVSALLGEGFFLSIEEALKAFRIDMV